MTVKANTPKLRQAINAHLSDPDVTVRGDDASDRGQDGPSSGSSPAVTLPMTGWVGDVEFPPAAQGPEDRALPRRLDGQRSSEEVVHPITSLPEGHADAACLAQLIRGHWSIENGVHHARDVTFCEDAHRARTGNEPLVLATIRNIITAASRLTGTTGIAAARRTASSDIHTAIAWFTGRTDSGEDSL